MEGAGPGKSSPMNEGLPDTARRFIMLGRLDGLRLARAIWYFAVVLFVVEFALMLFQLPVQLSALQQVATGGFHYLLVVQALIRILTPLFWLLLVRLVLEVCLHMLGEKTTDEPLIRGRA